MATVTHDQAKSPDRAPANQRPSTPREPVLYERLAIQRTLGNDYLQRAADCDRPGRQPGGSGCRNGCGGCGLGKLVQAKLTVGPAGDRYEQEADRVADRLVNSPATPGDPGVDIQRLSDGGGGGEALDVALPAGGGRALPTTVRAFMEPRFGQDFSDVRLHSDQDAHQLATRINARAFTYRSDIYLRRGESEYDHRLMAHELTHVVQQQGGSKAVQRAMSAELDQIESYLSYGIFDWAITDEEALRALELLKTLPRFQQAVFFANATFADRLRENLPDSRVSELDALSTDVAGMHPPTETIAEIESRLSYGLFDWAITDKDAVEALEMLKQLSGRQLAAALAAVDVARLMDNLPDARKSELTELYNRGLGLGGTRQTEEEGHPGTLIRSIAFRSDHGVMKSNADDWANSGAFFGEPEWFISNGKVVSNPISQTRNTNLTVQLSMNVLPVNAPPARMRLTGRSAEAALNFEFTGAMQGGIGQSVSMTSTGKLPDTITALENREVIWGMQWRDWKHEIGRTQHTIFVTIAAPRAPGEVTLKRMRTAVMMTGAVAARIGTVDPHPLVRGVMARWGRYNLDVQLGYNPGDEWKLADNLDVGAQCIDIVRFVNSLLQTVGMPGNATAVVIWAKPTPPYTAECNLWPHGGLRTYPPPANHPDWSAALIDGDNRPNAYEAALEFDYNSTLRYYPGGVRTRLDFTKPLDVLHIFKCLVWKTQISARECEFHQVLTTYEGRSCDTGIVRC